MPLAKVTCIVGWRKYIQHKNFNYKENIAYEKEWLQDQIQRFKTPEL